MKAASTRTLYRDLEGEERFRVLLFALARGDLSEANHLVTTTRRAEVEVRAQVLAAHRRFEALRSNFVGGVGVPLGMLTALEAIEPLLAKEATQGFGRGAVVFGAELASVVQQLFAPPATQVRALLVALDDLANEQLGVSAEPILALMPAPIRSGLAQHAWVIEAVDADEDDLRRARGILDPDEGEVLGAVRRS